MGVNYVRRPFMVEAWVWNETRDMFGHLVSNGMRWCSFDGHETENWIRNLKIQTPRASLLVKRDYYIIKNADGTFSCMSPVEFNAEYERAACQ